MPEESLSVKQVLTMLAEAPPRLAALTDGLPPARLQTARGPDEWSANEILAHLRACADVWGKCMAQIITQDKPTIRAISPRSWIKRTNYPKLEFQSSLRAYTAQRNELMALLQPLAPEGWSRSVTITGTGAPREWTVLFYAQRMALHEHGHLEQIAGIVK